MSSYSNIAPVLTKKIDWIEEMYYSETAEKLMCELENVPDEIGNTIPKIWEKINAADNDLHREDPINDYGAFLQRVGFKAGYIIAMNIARECYSR